MSAVVIGVELLCLRFSARVAIQFVALIRDAVLDNSGNRFAQLSGFIVQWFYDLFIWVAFWAGGLAFRSVEFAPNHSFFIKSALLIFVQENQYIICYTFVAVILILVNRTTYIRRVNGVAKLLALSSLLNIIVCQVERFVLWVAHLTIFLILIQQTVLNRG